MKSEPVAECGNVEVFSDLKQHCTGGRGESESFDKWVQGRRKEKNWRQGNNAFKNVCCQIKEKWRN